MTEESPQPPDEAGSEEAGLADHPLTALRLEKHQRHLAEGGYPYRFERSSLAAELHDKYADLEPGVMTTDPTVVAGRLRNVRRMGKLMFAVLQDSSGQIQLFVDRRVLGEDAFDRFADLDVGDWVGGAGTVMTSNKGELSVRLSSFELLAKALRPLPDKWHGLTDHEQRFRRRYLDLIVNDDARRTALMRSRVVGTLRREFERRGFVEFETPVLQLEAGGALARPFATHHNALGLDMYLRIATELHLKRLVVGGFERVFEIGRVFRNEGTDTTHNPEFTTLEAYQAFADYNDIMVLMEEIFPVVATAATGESVVQVGDRSIDFRGPYRRASVVDLASEAVGVDLSFEMDLAELRRIAAANDVEVHPSWGHGHIIYELCDELVSPTLWEPTFVIDHPKEVSPLTRVHRSDPNLTERFELFIGGREMCDAYSELMDPLEQRRRFEEQAAAKAAGEEETHPIDEDFLRALEYGFPPTGGLGIGVDRLVMLLAAHDNIREVILFPHLRPEA